MADQPEDGSTTGAPHIHGGAPVFVPIVKPPPGSRERRGRIPAWVMIGLAVGPLLIGLLLLWWSVAEDLSTPESTSWRFDILFAYLMLVPTFVIGILNLIGTIAQWRGAWIAFVISLATFALLFTIQNEGWVRDTSIAAAKRAGWDSRSCRQYNQRDFEWGTYCYQNPDRPKSDPRSTGSVPTVPTVPAPPAPTTPPATAP